MNQIFDFSQYQENIALLTDNNEKITYRNLEQIAMIFSRCINGRKLIFCLCNKQIGAVVGYYSSISNNLVPLLLDSTKDKDLLNQLICLYDPHYLWIPIKIYKKEYGCILYSAFDYYLVERRAKDLLLNQNLALLLATSGSTGSPKLVRISYENILNNAESIADYLNITANERPIMSLPMYYSYGLSVINSHLIKGATILLTDKPVIQKEFWRFAKNQKATSISGVPYTYEMLKRLRLFQMDLPCLRMMTQAGGKLNVSIAKEYMEQAKVLGKRFIVMYGQTEATARMSYLPWEHAIEKCGSIGIAIPGGKFFLMDENDNKINKAGIDGELVYIGQNVSMGYAESREDLAKGDVNNGMLHTGDVARMDEDGYYYITGRIKRFVKIFGNRVNLDATEQLVKAITTSCACVGVDDLLTIFTTEEGKEEEIKSLLVKKTGLNIRAFSVRFITSIPKNASGKIQYAELSRFLD